MAGLRIVLAADEALEKVVRESISAYDANLLSVTPWLATIPDGTVAVVAERALVAPAAAATLAGRARRGVKWPALQLRRPGEHASDATEPWAAQGITARECQLRLQDVLRAAVIDWVLAASAETAAQRYADSEKLRHILRAILTAHPPVRTLVEVKSVTGISPKEQNALWNRAMGPWCGLRLVEFLGWVVLLRAFGVRAPRWGWRAVARRVEKSSHGLQGLSERLFRMECSAIADEGLRPVVEFVDRVLRPLGLDDGL